MLGKCFTLVVILLGLITTTYSQQSDTSNTIGLLYAERGKVSEGVVLYAPLHSRNVFLVDNCGALVNQWEFDVHSTYSGTLLLEDGSVIKLVVSPKDNGIRKDACFERRSWDNTLLWKFCGEGRYAALHSDFYVLPNGNVLCLMKDRYSIADAIKAGAKPDVLTGNTFNTESVIEIKPTGTTTGEIVWEWNLWDHLIQDYDSTKLNYGNIIEQSRRLNINIVESNVHFNSIDYNEELDQILISSWSDHEIYIIDHTTTKEESASSAGGDYGFGGDFLFRWGNDRNFIYGRVQSLFGQHNPSWIPDDYGRFSGMISVFNNEYGHFKGEEVKSAIVIINIDPDRNGVYDLLEENTFMPNSYEYIWTGKINNDWMFSRIMSGVQVQPNGNLLVCEATKGRLSEIDAEGNVVWLYKSPDEGTENDLSTSRGLVEQGTEANPQVYKVKKYSPNYPPLKNIKLCNSNPVENINSITMQCVDEKKPKVNFDIKTENMALFAFEAEISDADSILWTFGDGNFSTEANSMHQFNIRGTYNVCLTGYNCYGSTEICKTVQVDEDVSINLDQFHLKPVIIQPNPVKNYVEIATSTTNLQYNNAAIYNVNGLLKMENVNLNKIVDVSSLKSGIYFVKLESKTGPSQPMLKFIKIN